MHLNLHHVLAFLSLEPWMIAIVIPVIALIFAGTMAISGMYFKGKERERMHQTARLALEKGQPIPDLSEGRMYFGQRQLGDHSPGGDIKVGLILLGVGVGLYIFFDSVGAHEARFIGAIPGCVGIALLVFALFAAMTRPKNDSYPNRTGQP